MSRSHQPEAKPKAASETPSEASKDVIIVHGRTDDQQGLKVLRARPERIELGEVRPLKEGQPLTGDVVQLKPREGTPWVCDVETQFRYSELPQAGKKVSDTGASSGHPGPARVATDAYRENWDAIWKRDSGDWN